MVLVLAEGGILHLHSLGGVPSRNEGRDTLPQASCYQA